MMQQSVKQMKKKLHLMVEKAVGADDVELFEYS
jgi:hypothetical protein